MKYSMFKSTYVERLYNGIIRENPIFVLTLGICPTLAVTSSATNGFGMGLTTTFVLTFSNFLIAALRKVIPDRVRVPSFIVIVATLVTAAQFLLQAYVPSLYESLGIYIPLIVVNCIILGRAESYASKNPALASLFDGLGMGLGFTLALTILGGLRELIGAGTLFNYPLLPSFYQPVTIAILAPGAFLVLACMIATQNYLRKKSGKPKKNCSCGVEGCGLCQGELPTRKDEKGEKA